MLQLILDWSEVWAPLIALIIGGAFFKPAGAAKRLIVIYLAIAFILNLIADVNWKYKDAMPTWFQDNNIIYNIHSVFRTLLFGYLFLTHRYLKNITTLVMLMLLYVIFVIINFGFTESALHFSSRIFSGESILLLCYSILYAIELIKDDDVQSGKSDPAFWSAIGLFIYESVNFFIFLSYSGLMVRQTIFAANIWSVHNIAYVLLCLFLLRSLYEPRHQ